MTGGLRLACMLGDGIGPEIVPAAWLRCWSSCGAARSWLVPL